MKSYDFPVYNVGSGNLARFGSDGELVYVEISPDIAGLPWSPEVGHPVPPGDFHPANDLAEEEMKAKRPPVPLADHDQQEPSKKVIPRAVQPFPSAAARFSDFFQGMAKYPWRIGLT